MYKNGAIAVKPEKNGKIDSAWLLFNMDYNVQKMHEKSDNVQNVQDLNGL